MTVAPNQACDYPRRIEVRNLGFGGAELRVDEYRRFYVEIGTALSVAGTLMRPEWSPCDPDWLIRADRPN